MAVPMPSAVVLIVCKTVLVGEPDDNAAFTHYQDRAWEITNGMMTCRRNEISLYDAAEAQGADPRPFTIQECQKAGIMLGAEWDMKHPNSKYRAWRVACPTPTIDLNTGEIISWILPDCGHRDTVICEMDTAI